MNNNNAMTMSFMVEENIVSLKEFLNGDSESQESDLDQELVAFVNRTAAKPTFVSVYAEAEEKDRKGILDRFKEKVSELNLEFNELIATDSYLWKHIN